MRKSGRRFSPKLWTKLLTGTLLLLFAIANITVADDEFVCRGKIVDAEGNPAVGYRVVYRTVGQAEISLSGPTDAEGRYEVDLPADAECLPVAVRSPRGKRIELGEQVPVTAGPDATRDIQLGVSLAAKSRRTTLWKDGSDRLFLSFVEDAVVTRGQRYEVQVEFGDFETQELTVGRIIGAFQFDSLPDLEFGGSIGFGSVDRLSGVAEGSGLIDTDLWAKLYLGPNPGADTEWAFGAVVTLPTGDSDMGLGFDGFRSKLFGTARFNLPGAIISTHLGVRVNEDGELAGTFLEGEVAGAASIGVLIPLGLKQSLTFEADYEGERFSGGEPEAEVLGGLNWELPRGSVRLAVAVGLADGAADFRVLGGWAVDF